MLKGISVRVSVFSANVRSAIVFGVLATKIEKSSGKRPI